MIYRVEIRKDGAVASCNVVESALRNGGRIYYVEAPSKERAIDLVKKAFARLAAKADRRLAEDPGLCRQCMKRQTNGKSLCPVCMENQKRLVSEMRDIARLPPDERARALSERAVSNREKRADQYREMGLKSAAKHRERANARWDAATFVASADQAIVLRQCLRAYDRDPANFRSWLLAKLGQEDSPCEPCNPFGGWTDEEVERYAETGERPQRTAAE